jgi:UDP-N-acetylmuramate: L-alanyl-gamma-D-glutamyl-meso-diaminopimelate ligase
MAAARHAGVPVEVSLHALTKFTGVRRRLELRAEFNDIRLYDDFAHHPTAIESTLAGMRGHVGENRIWVLLEPRSNTMRMGIHKQQLAMSLAGADVICLYQPEDMDWDLNQVAADLGDRATVYTDVDAIVETLRQQLSPGDHIVVMSNGSFDGIHLKLENMLKLL